MIALPLFVAVSVPPETAVSVALPPPASIPLKVAEPQPRESRPCRA
jgi:hypothetical protein